MNLDPFILLRYQEAIFKKMDDLKIKLDIITICTGKKPSRTLTLFQHYVYQNI